MNDPNLARGLFEKTKKKEKKQEEAQASPLIKSDSSAKCKSR